METLITEIAQRIRGLREILDISEEEMAEVTGVALSEYRELEGGTCDFPFTFLLKCSEHFHVDIVELMTGENPKLSYYTVVRRGKGLPIDRRRGFEYHHLAYLFKNKLAEPFLVTAPACEEAQAQTHYSTHAGQEFDYILKGSLRVDIEGRVEILHAGDSIYYDSGHRHDMRAAGGEDCDFLAVVLKRQDNVREENEHAGA